jgi:hypothetical protein
MNGSVIQQGILMNGKKDLFSILNVGLRYRSSNLYVIYLCFTNLVLTI